MPAIILQNCALLLLLILFTEGEKEVYSDDDIEVVNDRSRVCQRVFSSLIILAMFALGCNTTQTEPGVLATLPKFTLATPMHSELYIAKSTLLLALTVLSLMLFVLSCDCLSHLSLGFS